MVERDQFQCRFSSREILDIPGTVDIITVEEVYNKSLEESATGKANGESD
ncbi:MAG: hypothetical protein ACLFWL_05305 [Candidatus Brocadiia bacterium]